MATHRYSHALVLSHYQDSGLLCPGQRRMTPKKSARSSRSRKIESGAISEVISPVNSPPTSSSMQDSYFRRKQTPKPEGLPLRPPSRTSPAQPLSSLNRSDSIITQIYAPSRPLSPDPEIQHEKRLQPSHAAPRLHLSSMPDTHTPVHALRGGRAQQITLSQNGGPQQHPIPSSLQVGDNSVCIPLQEPCFDTEDESDHDIPKRHSYGILEVPHLPQQANSTPKANTWPSTSSQLELHDTSLPKLMTSDHLEHPDPPSSRRKQPQPSREEKSTLEPAALNIEPKKSREQANTCKSIDKVILRPNHDRRPKSSHNAKSETRQSFRTPRSPTRSEALDVRKQGPHQSMPTQDRSVKTMGKLEYSSMEKSSYDLGQRAPLSSNETNFPREPASLNMRVDPSSETPASEKPLPETPDYPDSTPRARPQRYRTRGFASPSRHSWTTDGPVCLDSIDTQIKPIRNLAPSRKPLAGSTSSTHAIERQKVAKDCLSIDVPTSKATHHSSPGAKEPRELLSDPLAPKSARSHHDISRSTDDHHHHHHQPPSSTDSSPADSLPSTNNSSNRHSAQTTQTTQTIQTTPPTSPSLSLTSLFSFSSNLSKEPDRLSKIPTSNKHMTVLPWDRDDKMDPSIFCPCPSPPLSPRSASPSSSIDNALPPPIARVRPESKGRKASELNSAKKKMRPRALSSPTGSLASPPPPIPSESLSRQSSPRPRFSFTMNRPQPVPLASVAYAAAKAGPAPIPTTEKVLVPPPPGRDREESRDKEKEVEKKKRRRYFWQGGEAGMREIFGLGRRENGVSMRGMVPG